jgi:hypothetical protein
MQEVVGWILSQYKRLCAIKCLLVLDLGVSTSNTYYYVFTNKKYIRIFYIRCLVSIVQALLSLRLDGAVYIV